jgi:hypothetical protein
MNKTEAIGTLTALRHDYDDCRYPWEQNFRNALDMAINAMEKLMEYEKMERTGKLIRMPDCRRCKHAYRDDTRCYECLANMTCWPNNFEPRKKVKK